MAVWRKILVSGSNAHVAGITASQAGDPTDKAEVLFRDNTSGQFLSTGSIFFTASYGNQLYLDKTGLSAYNISASGTPNSVSDNAEVVFRNPFSTGLEATSSLTYNSSQNQIEFLGAISGSFTGDGSNLTGVIGTLAESLVNGDGIISTSLEDFTFDGTQRVDVQVYTSSNSGLQFTGGGMRLATSLPGDGLKWTHSSNFSTMSIDTASNSGLTIDGNGALTIDSTIGGNGLQFTNGILSVALAANSGLATSANAIKLSNGLPGLGLQYRSGLGSSIIDLDTQYVVTSESRVVFRTGSSNLTLSATSTPDNISVDGDGFSARLIDSPIFTYDLNNTLTGNFTFEDDVTVEGNFTVSGSLISTSIETDNLNIADQFILINSGTIAGDGASKTGGFVVMTSNTNGGRGAFLFYDGTNERWGVSDDAEGINSESHQVTDDDHAALVTSIITDDNEATLINTTPLFGNTNGNRVGQLAITTAATTNESSVFIYA